MKNTKIKKNNPLSKLIIVGVIMVLSFAGYKHISIKRQSNQKRDAFETQKKIMIEYWEKEGLTDDEIKYKLEGIRQDRTDGGKNSGRQDIMRVLGASGSRK